MKTCTILFGLLLFGCSSVVQIGTFEDTESAPHLTAWKAQDTSGPSNTMSFVHGDGGTFEAKVPLVGETLPQPND